MGSVGSRWHSRHSKWHYPCACPVGSAAGCQVHAAVYCCCVPLSPRCIDALRQLESAESRAHPAVGLLAMQAFLAAGNVQQAEMEAAGAGQRATKGTALPVRQHPQQ